MKKTRKKRRDAVPSYCYFYVLLMARDEFTDFSYRVGPFKYKCRARTFAKRYEETHDYSITSRDHMFGPPDFGWRQIPRTW